MNGLFFNNHTTQTYVVIIPQCEQETIHQFLLYQCLI